jgi:hypothetical protein
MTFQLPPTFQSGLAEKSGDFLVHGPNRIHNP